MRYLFTSLSFISLLICSCEKETLKTGQYATNVSFQTDVLPMFQACTDCHDIGANPDLTENHAYNSLIEGDYVNITSPEESVLIKTLNSSSHSSFLNQEQKNKILGWIAEGAKKN